MADVFISYAHSTAREARAAAENLRAQGYSVWLDEDLPANRAFTHAIEEELASAKAALVIWSADAAKSEWVLSEANRAREARKLVQVSVDRVRLPMPFDQIQCADLADWLGGGNHAGWAKVAASLAALVTGRAVSRDEAQPALATAPTSEPLLAVLAFDNLSGDPELAYFSDGVSEEILDTVARGSDLKVLARTSSFQFRGADKSVRRIMADLKATHLLDGSVRRSGQRVRVSAQLVDCASETTLWSDRFDRELIDVFALQDEIASAVAQALERTFSPRPAQGDIDPGAYELYLRARDTVRAAGSEGLSIVNDMLRTVVERAPAFADGWALYATALIVKDTRTGRGDPHARSEAAAAIDAALRLDPNNAMAIMARVSATPEGAYEAAEALLQELRQVAPNDSWTYSHLSARAFNSGRTLVAADFARHAVALDPLDVWPASLLANSYEALEHPEAISLYLRGRAKWPESTLWSNLLFLGAVYRQDWAVFAEAEAYAEAHGHFADGGLRGSRAYARAVRDGDAGYADRVRRAIETELSRSGSAPPSLAIALAVLVGADEAFDYLDRASYDFILNGVGGRASGTAGYDLGIIFMTEARRRLAPSPRFVSFCKKLGFLDFWLNTGLWPDLADETPYDFRAEAQRLARSA
jgi:TolB-like protein